MAGVLSSAWACNSKRYVILTGFLTVDEDETGTSQNILPRDSCQSATASREISPAKPRARRAIGVQASPMPHYFPQGPAIGTTSHCHLADEPVGCMGPRRSRQGSTSSMVLVDPLHTVSRRSIVRLYQPR
jgi:hypothetical protein